jgi:hypothetical protein
MDPAIALIGIVWFLLNVTILMMLRPPAGQTSERMIVSFPGAWMAVGLLLTLSFGGSVLVTAFAVF